jgi:uncharacterized protein (DUF58 family)
VKSVFKNIYLSDRFFYLAGILVFLLVCSFFLPVIFSFVQTLVLLAVAMVFGDVILLFAQRKILSARRTVPHVLSLGSENEIGVLIESNSGLKLRCSLTDELPPQFQERKQRFSFSLNKKESLSVRYVLRPLSRGEYNFGNLLFFIKSKMGLVERRFIVEAEQTAAVYPSIIELKKYEFSTNNQIAVNYGTRNVRRIGHSYEFEQIKEYVRGDDPRQINWKASGKLSKLMVNHYEEEKSHQVFSVIDLSRNMLMPFDGLSLLDYSINASLVLSKVILQKHDKAGLLTFSDKNYHIVKPDRGKNQLQKIMESLYRQQEQDAEANYDLLYHLVRNNIKTRSLIILFTNFESIYNLKRVLPLLQRICRQHLLITILFENTEVARYVQMPSGEMDDIYTHTIARKHLYEKQQIAHTVRGAGIHCILTQPAALTSNAINKYLEMKAMNMI